MHVSGHEGTSGAHSGISKLNVCFHQYASVGLTQRSQKLRNVGGNERSVRSRRE